MRQNCKSLITALLGVVIGALITVVVYQVRDREAKLNARYVDWAKMNLVLKTLDENYVDSIDHKKITDAAITAALSELDPHSIYLLPKELTEAEGELDSNFEGIGIQFNVPNDTAIVLEVIPGGPSEKIGLMQGDRILRVDGEVIAGVKFPQDSMVRRMKGPAGTKVNIVVKRGSEEIPFDITRGKIPLHCVDAAFMVNDTTGYIRLSKFSRSTFDEVLSAGSKLQKQGMTYLIFDIRSNTGGYFDQALLLSNLFLEKGKEIVYLQGVHRKKEIYKADGSGPFKDVKLSVLIDETSASSSEIFAGAMQDNARATIIGRRSFGKGLVQEPLYFTDGSGIRLTVSRFYTPSGRCLQKPYGKDYAYELEKRLANGEYAVADSMKKENGGIVPDVFVPMDTTKAGRFYISCVRKATTMRFAAQCFDVYRKQLTSIDDYSKLLSFLNSIPLESEFLAFAKAKDSIQPDPVEWESDKVYLMSQVRALVGRFSKLGDNAYYHLYLPVDKAMAVAIGQ